MSIPELPPALRVTTHTHTPTRRHRRSLHVFLCFTVRGIPHPLAPSCLSRRPPPTLTEERAKPIHARTHAHVHAIRNTTCTDMCTVSSSRRGCVRLCEGGWVDAYACAPGSVDDGRAARRGGGGQGRRNQEKSIQGKKRCVCGGGGEGGEEGWWESGATTAANTIAKRSEAHLPAHEDTHTHTQTRVREREYTQE